MNKTEKQPLNFLWSFFTEISFATKKNDGKKRKHVYYAQTVQYLSKHFYFSSWQKASLYDLF